MGKCDSARGCSERSWMLDAWVSVDIFTGVGAFGQQFEDFRPAKNGKPVFLREKLRAEENYKSTSVTVSIIG